MELGKGVLRKILVFEQSSQFLSQQVYAEVYQRSGKKPEEATLQISHPPPSQVLLLQLENVLTSWPLKA